MHAPAPTRIDRDTAGPPAVDPAHIALPHRDTPASRDVLFMATCLGDSIFCEAARAAVEVLEHLGCRVHFPAKQTCCGQPAFNAGSWDEARAVVRHTARVFRGSGPVVVPSASCVAMLRHGALLAFADEPDRAEIEALAARTWEMADFIVNGLDCRAWPGRYPARVAFHRSCHTRGTDSAASATLLLDSIEGLTRLDVEESGQCCGFGGTFSVSFPHISTAMGRRKIGFLTAGDPDCIASLDAGCLLHLGGLLDRDGPPVRRVHVAEILRDALQGARPS